MLVNIYAGFLLDQFLILVLIGSVWSEYQPITITEGQKGMLLEILWHRSRSNACHYYSALTTVLSVRLRVFLWTINPTFRIVQLESVVVLISYSRVMEKITSDLLESENIYGRHRVNTKLTIPYQL